MCRERLIPTVSGELRLSFRLKGRREKSNQEIERKTWVERGWGGEEGRGEGVGAGYSEGQASCYTRRWE